MNSSELLKSCKNGDIDYVKKCVDEKCVDKNCKDGSGNTLLMLAIEGMHVDIFQILIQLYDINNINDKDNINYKNNEGKTALMILIEKRNIDYSKSLIILDKIVNYVVLEYDPKNYNSINYIGHVITDYFEKKFNILLIMNYLLIHHQC